MYKVTQKCKYEAQLVRRQV